jgi:hypothetical protein
MVSRLAAALVVLATLGVAGQPCVALATSQAQHDCCPPDLCATPMAHDASPGAMPTSDRCCATSEQGQDQQQSRSPEPLAAVACSTPMAPSPVLVPALRERRSFERAAATRSAPLHILFAVFLV